MAERDHDDEEFVIKIPASVFRNADERSKEAPKATQAHDFFRRTSIFSTRVERHSEHGKTEVKSLGFEPDQRSKVLELLDNPVLFSKLPNLLNIIYRLGCENDGEKRYYAAMAVAQLATKQPFLDLKEAAILPWAKDDNPAIRNSAAVALSELLNQKQNESEVQKLLKHWSSLDNPLLTDAALSTFYWVADSHANEALDAIGSILKSGGILHYPKVIDLFETIYESSPCLAIDRLYNWLLPVTYSDICYIAGILSSYIQLDDVAENEELCRKVIEMICGLWDNPRMPLHEEMQERTTILVEIWASEAVEKMNKEPSTDQTCHQAFFHELYRKCEGKRNRLGFYLQLWERNRGRARERERMRAARRGEDSSALGAEDKFSYRHLSPQGLI